MSKTRAIRFTAEEDKNIELFLSTNPIFDFSTLARTAILTFIKNPKLEIKGIKSVSAKQKFETKRGLNV